MLQLFLQIMQKEYTNIGSGQEAVFPYMSTNGSTLGSYSFHYTYAYKNRIIDLFVMMLCNISSNR